MGKWEMVSFGDAIVDVTKLATKIKKEDYLSQGQYQIIDQGKEYLAGYTNKSDGLYTDIPAIVFGDHTRIIKYVDDPLFIGADGVKLLKTNDGFNSRFVYYYLKSCRIIDTGYNRHFKWLKELSIPLPPLPVQQQIADVLDRASALIEKRKAQIEKLDLLVKSQFIEMFGDPVTNPKGWEKKKLKDCLQKIENGVSPKCEAFPALCSQYGVLKLSAVTYGHYIEQENKQLFADTKFDAKIEVCNKDLLMTRKNTYDLVGMCAYVFSTRPGLMLPDLIFRLIPKKEIHTIYLWRLMNCEFIRPEIKKLASGTSGSMPNISKARLNSFEIPVPPIEPQRKFAAFVHQVETQKSLLQKSLANLEQNYKSLMQKCFRGEVFS